MELKSSMLRTKVEPSDVYKALEDRKFIEKIYNEILHDIKNSSAYIKLKRIALQHLASIEAGENDSQLISELTLPNTVLNIEKRKKLTDVGYLSASVASILTKTVHEKLQALQDDIYAASQVIIEELEGNNPVNAETSNPKNSLPEQNGTDISGSPSNKRNKKRCIESDTGIYVSSSKRLSNRLKKPNSKYFAEDILTSVTDHCFDNASKQS